MFSRTFQKEKDLVWQFGGNCLQYDFNTDIFDLIKQNIWTIQNGKVDYSRETLNDAVEKLRVRNKHICIADSTEGGWETVRQYESNPIASDSDDDYVDRQTNME